MTLAAILAFLRSPLAKYLGYALAALAVLALLAAFIHAHDKSEQAKGAARVQATIDAPVTGWRARLAQCEANGATLTAAVQRQNAYIEAQAQAGADATARAASALATAQAATKTAQGKVRTVLAPLTAADTCQRMLEADRRLVGSLR